MKKISVLLFLCLVTISLQAQNRFSYSVEVAAGAGFVRGPRVTVMPQFVAQYDLGSGFRIGARAGIRYAQPCLQYITVNGEYNHTTYVHEFGIPLFLRLGYGKEKLFANVDAGYAICALPFYGAGREGFTGKIEPNYSGFFIEPQIGWKVGRKGALALGVLLQQSAVSDHVQTESGFGTPSYQVSQKVTRRTLLTPAITLRYAFFF